MKNENANASIPLGKITICDSFWNKYIYLVKDVIIPYQWKILNDKLEDVETSHCIENFKIAAGYSEGNFQGAVFQDTDLAKWLEAVGYVLTIERDEELEKCADEVIELIGKAQQKDGYLNTYFTIKEPTLKFTNLQEGHELYTAGHMIEAAIAYYEGTGKVKFLQIVSKLADLICDTFGPGESQLHGYPGHQEIELALLKLYRVTGQERYIKTAKYFIDRRGVGENYFLQEEKTKQFKRIFPEFNNYDPKYSQSHLPVREQQTAEGHAVRATYMYCAMADIAYEYEEEELMEACKRLWDNMVNKRMYITGSIGSSGILERFTTDYDLPNDINYSETCASIGLALFGKRMADINKDASYMDVVERALYNTVLSGIAMDGKSFFYVNPLEVWPENCLDRTSHEHIKPTRQKWFGVACCPPNIARTLASLGQYIYFQDDETIYTNLYIANQTQVIIDKVPFTITLEGAFPWQSELTMKIKGTDALTTQFAYRIPDYVKGFQIYKNNKRLDKIQIKKGYAIISGTFYEDEIRIVFDMPPVFVHANPNVRANVGKIALMKGPLVYCLEEMDNGENLSALYIDTKQPLEVKHESVLGGSDVILFKGKRISSKEWDTNQLYAKKGVVFEEVELKAVPYCYWGNRIPGEMLVWLKEFYQ